MFLAVVSGGDGWLLQAQAWTPAKGEGTVSLTYQNYDVAGHYDARGRKNNNGGTQSQVAVTEVDYGMTDTIGVTVNLAFIASKYCARSARGPSPSGGLHPVRSAC